MRVSGFRRFVQGFGPQLSQGGSINTIVFVTYEVVKDVLEVEMRISE
ncbi:putative mitochondrial substrate/solute carrier [Helianthus annuus]|nr:putative mitochondrial substrate/solute carrier [Helianthus annuus]